MTIIGIVGKSGTGKTTLGRILEGFGFHHVNLDEVAKTLTPSLLPRIVEEFGEEFVKDGEVDRKALGELVFHDRDSLNELNAIFADAIWDNLRETLKVRSRVSVEGFSLPLGLRPDLILHLVAPEAVLIARLLLREPGTCLDTLRGRLASQPDLPPSGCYVETIKVGNMTREEMVVAVEEVLDKYLV